MGIKETIKSMLKLESTITNIHQTLEQTNNEQTSTYDYQRISPDDMILLLKDFQTCIADFLNSGLEYNKVKYTICGLILIDAILSVDKQIFNFKVARNMVLNTVEKAALFAYWIVKLRPISITDKRYINKDGYNNKINELFAIHYLISALVGTGKIVLFDGHKGANLSLSHPLIKRLSYEFRYSNLTADSILVLANTIVTDTLEYYNNHDK